MNTFNINDRVRFKNSGTKQIGTIIGIIKANVYDKKGRVIVRKGEYKVRMDNKNEGSYTPACASELELVS